MWHGCGGCIRVIWQKCDKGKCVPITICEHATIACEMVASNEDAKALIKIKMEVGLEKKDKSC